MPIPPPLQSGPATITQMRVRDNARLGVRVTVSAPALKWFSRLGFPHEH